MEKQSTPRRRIWQVIFPIVSSHPSGITFASAEIALLPPHTNVAAVLPCIRIVLPQVALHFAGWIGGAHTRCRIEHFTELAPIRQPTLLPGSRKLVCSSTGCVDGRKAVDGTFGRTVLITVRTRTTLLILTSVLILVLILVL